MKHRRTPGACAAARAIGGVASGMLSLSRKLGLIAGASAMGAVFAAASASASDPATLAFGMRMTFAVAAALVVAALAIAAGGRALVQREASGTSARLPV